MDGVLLSMKMNAAGRKISGRMNVSFNSPSFPHMSWRMEVTSPTNLHGQKLCQLDYEHIICFDYDSFRHTQSEGNDIVEREVST